MQTETTLEAQLIELDPSGGGHGAVVSSRSSPRPTPRTSRDAWERVQVSIEPVPAGTGGGGHGLGFGRGIGLGDGGGIRMPEPVPAAPPPPPEAASTPAKARPAQLIYPRRDRPVEDEADLFIARVTVDEDGDVIGARMIKTRPGARGDQAATAIWHFRYAPALDDRGVPVRATLEQRFQIR